MNYIIYDVEATCWDGAGAFLQQEIIEIGAVLVNEYAEVEDSFNAFIRPKLNPNLSVFCQQLTSIRQRDVDRAAGFEDVVEDFKDWAGVYDEEYVLCSWGNFDRKILVADCSLHDLESDWALQHMNLKQQYQQMKRLHRPRGLKKAVETEGFDFTGVHHRAISDAQNLAKVFAKYIENWVW